MRRTRLIWQLYPSYLLITLSVLFIITIYTSNSLYDFYLSYTVKDLKVRASLAADIVRESFSNNDYNTVCDICRNLGNKTSTRYTVILVSGKVVGDSEEDPGIMDNHQYRSEVADALAGKTGSVVRYSKTLNKNMVYVAIPLGRPDNIEGVIRASIPATSFDSAIRSNYIKIAYFSLLLSVLTAIVTWYLSRRITRPLEEMKRGIDRFAIGDFSLKLVITDRDSLSLEMLHLSDTINNMAEQLDDRVKTVIRQKQELEAVFECMMESVIVVDFQERFISINKAAAKLLDVDREKVHGRSVVKTTGNTGLMHFIKHALDSYLPIEDEIVFTDDNGDERFLQAHGAILHNGHDRNVGALIVLNDVTKLRRLEKVRQDFVTNVSHELKTPITAIKGFMESLLDSEMDDPETSRHFMEIVRRNADRLNAIIDDMLVLSRLEKEEKNKEVFFEEMSLEACLQESISICGPRISTANMTIDLYVEEGLTVSVNASLLEHAVVNLIDNAIKYSEAGSRIHVEAKKIEHEAIISVRDWGCGIENKELPRLFERFYRTDKARSRKLGGTGLGLAIVKHIAKVHGGHVTVQSEPGKGSVFSIHLPIRQNK